MQLYTRRPEADAEIIRLRKEGKKAREIMQALGVSCSRVTRVLLESGLSKPRMHAGQRAEVIALREQGLSHGEIATRMGVSRPAIGQMLRRNRQGRNKLPNHIEIRDGVAHVTLSKGYVAKVDVADVPLISSYRWAAQVTEDGEVYAIAQRNGYRVMMHRLIMGNPKGKIIDHKHHDTLDNRRSQLQPTDYSGNGRNARRARSNGLPRLIRNTRYGKLYATITISTKPFDTVEEAVAARNELLKRIHGSDAVITEKFMPEAVDPDTGEVLDG